MGTTLVLNADGNPVSIVPLSSIHWQDAVRIIVCGRAVAMENYDTWVVRSPSIQLRMPSVIMLKDYQHHNGKVEFSRQNLILRDKFTCQYCMKQFAYKDLTFDHVVPRRDGGKTHWENIVSACYDCNQEKAHYRTMKPNREPHRPTYWELSNNRKKFPISVPNADWVQYLNWESEVTVNGESENCKHHCDADDNLPFFGE